VETLDLPVGLGPVWTGLLCLDDQFTADSCRRWDLWAGEKSRRLLRGGFRRRRVRTPQTALAVDTGLASLPPIATAPAVASSAAADLAIGAAGSRSPPGVRGKTCP
jgi:hypothetical protein